MCIMYMYMYIYAYICIHIYTYTDIYVYIMCPSFRLVDKSGSPLVPGTRELDNQWRQWKGYLWTWMHVGIHNRKAILLSSRLFSLTRLHLPTIVGYRVPCPFSVSVWAQHQSQIQRHPFTKWMGRNSLVCLWRQSIVSLSMLQRLSHNHYWNPQDQICGAVKGPWVM